MDELSSINLAGVKFFYILAPHYLTQLPLAWFWKHVLIILAMKRSTWKNKRSHAQIMRSYLCKLQIQRKQNKFIFPSLENSVDCCFIGFAVANEKKNPYKNSALPALNYTLCGEHIEIFKANIKKRKGSAGKVHRQYHLYFSFTAIFIRQIL